MLGKLFKLGLPISLMQFSSASLNIMNTFLISCFAIADLVVLGGANGIFWFIQITASAFLWPMDAIFSQQNGKPDSEKGRYLIQGLYFTCFICIASFISFLFAIWFFYSSLDDLVLIQNMASYLTICSFSIPPLLFFYLIQKLWQSYFITKAFFVMSFFSCLINLIVGIFLVCPIFNLCLGSDGIAWATVATRVFLLIAAIGWMVVELNKRSIKLHLRFSLDKTLFWRIAKTCLPSGAHGAIEMFSLILLSLFSVHHGASAMTANQLALSFIMASFPFYWGITSAASTYVGCHVADKNSATLSKVIKSAYALSQIYSVSITLIMAAIVVNLSYFISLHEDALKMSYALIFIVTVSQYADCFQSVCAGILRGASLITPVLIANIISYYFFGLIVFVFCFYYLGLGYLSIWLSFSTGINVSAVINYALTRRFLKNKATLCKSVT